MADRDINTLHVLAFLVDDGRDRDTTFADTLVTDNELALAAAHGDHGVDRHNASLDRLGDVLPGDDARGDALDRIDFGGVGGWFAVDRASQGIDDTTKEGGADGHGQDLTGRLDDIPLFEVLVLAEQGSAHFVFEEREREAVGAAGEEEELTHLTVGETTDHGDAVTDAFDFAHAFDGANIFETRDFVE